MAKMNKLIMLQSMMGEDTDPGILEVYLELARQAILNRMYPYAEDYGDEDVPEKYVAIQLKTACYLLNKRGAEGQIQHIENGIHRNYGSADIPDGMLKDIVPFCRVIR